VGNALTGLSFGWWVPNGFPAGEPGRAGGSRRQDNQAGPGIGDEADHLGHREIRGQVVDLPVVLAQAGARHHGRQRVPRAWRTVQGPDESEPPFDKLLAQHRIVEPPLVFGREQREPGDYPAGAVLYNGKDVNLRSVEQVGGEEVQCQDPLRLGPQKRPSQVPPGGARDRCRRS
jgi:hypothetical protein